MRYPFLITLLASSLWPCVTLAQGADPAANPGESRVSRSLQSWSAFSLQALARAPWSLSLYAEARIGNEPSPPLQLFSGLVLGYRAGDDLLLGAAVRHIHLAQDSAAALQLGRIEGEVTPLMRLPRQMVLSLRNRLEIIDGPRSAARMRLRQRLQLQQGLALGPLRAVVASGETFVEVVNVGADPAAADRALRIREVRIVPLGLRFGLGRALRLDVGYLMQYRRGQASPAAHVLATTLVTHL